MRALEFIRDHVTFKLPYDFCYHMKTPNMIKSQPFIDPKIYHILQAWHSHDSTIFELSNLFDKYLESVLGILDIAGSKTLTF